MALPPHLVPPKIPGMSIPDPQVPPTDEDVYLAEFTQSSMLQTIKSQGNTDPQKIAYYGQLTRYLANIQAEHALAGLVVPVPPGPAPAPAQPAGGIVALLTQIHAAVQTNSTNFENLQTTMEENFQTVQDDVKQIKRLAVIACNRSAGMDDLEIVPFHNGDMPPATLPQLTNASDISNLNTAQAAKYLRGYGVRTDRQPNELLGKKKLIAKKIGCLASVE
ncbi:hypothetical protein D9757_010521 [Collybiopsis confluens]|uniref:Mug135-like C-terminal domain-containing protein n=1 Tax=Collybiopsis confluens TaxID=2823264 RepID=A0A8H5LSU8_9AGAR|nr:hypothetical protein D9757_010521 [Collybiopsis confluens]